MRFVLKRMDIMFRPDLSALTDAVMQTCVSTTQLTKLFMFMRTHYMSYNTIYVYVDMIYAHTSYILCGHFFGTRVTISPLNYFYVTYLAHTNKCQINY